MLYNIDNLFSYDSDTGALTRLPIEGDSRYNKRYAGKQITCKNYDGYIVFPLHGKTTYAHRYIYERVVSKIPDGFCIDHINKNKSDNRLANLRLVSRADNGRNLGLRRTNTTGYNGVVARGTKFIAQVKYNYGNEYLGMYPTAEAAKDAVVARQKELGFFEGHGK